METRLKMLIDDAKAATDLATELRAKARDEDRNLTAEETEQVKAALAKFADLDSRIDQAKADQAILARLDEIGAKVGGLDTGRDVKAQPVRGIGAQVMTDDRFKAWADAGATGPSPKVNVGGFKDLIRATDVAAMTVPHREPEVVRLPWKNLSVRNLINVVRTDSDTIEFVRQITREGAAKFVPEAETDKAVGDSGTTAVQAGEKPWMKLAYKSEKITTATVAVLAAITKRALTNVPQMQAEIEHELVTAVDQTLDKAILQGTGSDGEFVGILKTSGIQELASQTDVIKAIRNAKTKLQVVQTAGGAITPNAVLIHPVGAEHLDLLKDTTGRYLSGGPWVTGPSTIWGLPMVVTEAVGETELVVGDFTKATLFERGNMTIDVFDQHKDWAARNLLAVRAECDAALAVKVPSAFVKVTMTSWS